MNSIFSKMKSLSQLMLVIIILGGGAWGFISFYPYIFARTVTGTIEKVEKVLDPSMAVLGTGPNNSLSKDIFSYAVGIKEPSGETVTASSEDRQWAAATIGKCVEAKFYPYPPWMLDKSGTYYGARLLKMFDCAGNP